ncbi:MAG: hypothetical protein LBQ48_04885, partial [Oscillospiraceae bacterium]|nr:hypothetical protein [Oscillospiraceae bacterium]
NYGTNIGIIGAGVIGSLLIRLLQRHEFNLFVFDPFLSELRAAELGVKTVSLERLFSECSVVSNHLANNARTQGMLRYEHFSRLPEGGVFLNTGRGAQVVEADLARALAEREDLTAVLDVTWPEPPEAGHPFYTLPGVVLTPHIAGSMGREVVRLGRYMLEEYRRYAQGMPCLYEVTAEMLETMA